MLSLALCALCCYLYSLTRICEFALLHCRLLDQETAVYILTLGTSESHRHLGIASQLIQRVVARARQQLSRAVYLHVVEYNVAAVHFYQKNGFEELTTLRNFYYIG